MNPREAAGAHTGQGWQVGKPAPSVAKVTGYDAPRIFRVTEQPSETSKTNRATHTPCYTVHRVDSFCFQKPPQTKSETYPSTRPYSPTQAAAAQNAAQHGKRAALGGCRLQGFKRVAPGVSDLPPRYSPSYSRPQAAGGQA